MHLTGGQFGGRKVLTPVGYKVEVKPTLSKVRESVFNVLCSHFCTFSTLEGFSKLSFLDIFTGSGIMALEAYSRGFKEILAIEKNRLAYNVVKKTFSGFENAQNHISLINADSLKFLAPLDKKFDVIYIDPPWDYDYTPIIELALKKLNKNGVIVVEYDKKNPYKKGTELSAPQKQDGREILPFKEKPFKEKTYGRCKLDFYTL